MKVKIINYGMGNLGSVARAFEECGAEVSIAFQPEDLSDFTHLVLPGVGAFSEGMSRLRASGWELMLREIVLHQKKPLLGICLGMQLLMEEGTEGGTTTGLGFIEGHVPKIVPNANERLPHVGWNEIFHVGQETHHLLNYIPSGTDFYFVHSYHAVCRNPSNVIATTPFSGGINSVIANQNVIGVQFHPEKSQRAGFQLIRNFLQIS